MYLFTCALTLFCPCSALCTWPPVPLQNFSFPSGEGGMASPDLLWASSIQVWVNKFMVSFSSPSNTLSTQLLFPTIIAYLHLDCQHLKVKTFTFGVREIIRGLINMKSPV